VRDSRRAAQEPVLHLIVVRGGEADVAQIARAPRGRCVGKLEEGRTSKAVLLALRKRVKG
jgi:hypothetical protein